MAIRAPSASTTSGLGQQRAHLGLVDVAPHPDHRRVELERAQHGQCEEVARVQDQVAALEHAHAGERERPLAPGHVGVGQNGDQHGRGR